MLFEVKFKVSSFRILQLDLELIKVDIVHFVICQKNIVSKDMVGSIILLVYVGEALGISGCCGKEFVTADLGDTFTLSE